MEKPGRLEKLTPEIKDRLQRNLEACRQEIAAAAVDAARAPEEVTLLPVTKYAPPIVLRHLHALGLRRFGENRVQRLVTVARELADLPEIQWDFIGHLQRNKVRKAIELCAFIQSVDSLRVAQEIARYVQASGSAPPSLFVEVNLSKEKNKTGLREQEVDDVVKFLFDSSVLKDRNGETALSGLMTMAPATDDQDVVRDCFRRLRDLRDEYIQRGLLPVQAELSMGMSVDFAAAIAEGATVVRIGRRLFEGVLFDDADG